MELGLEVGGRMPDAFLLCSSCKKPNSTDGRYCIGCGSILSPVYCSSCGTPNPDGVNQCLECGNPVPSMKGMHWSPIVNVLEPTSAMTEEETLDADSPQSLEKERSTEGRSRFPRIRSILNRK
jgi:hypothetical protein